MTTAVRSGLGHRVSSGALVALLLVTALAAPVWYVGSVIEDESAFVTVAEDVLVAPAVRRFVAETTAAVVIDVVQADPALTGDLPDPLRTFVVPATRIATTQVVDLAFRTLGNGPVARALDAALREVHRQLVASDDSVTLEVAALVVRVAREIGGPAIGFAVANAVQGSSFATFVLVEPGGRGSQVLAAVRSIPNIGTVLLAVVVGLALVALAAASDRRRALVGVGIALVTGAVVAVVAVHLLVHQQLAGGAIGGEIADIVSADFAHQQRALQLVGAVVVAVGLALGRSPGAVAFRRVPGELWRHDPAAVGSATTIVGSNPPAVRIAVWLAGAVLLVGWPAPTARVVVTIVAFTLAALVVIAVLTSDGSVATRWRGGRPVDPAVVVGSDTRRRRFNLGVVTLGVVLLWPSWDLQFVVDAFSVAAIVQTVADVRAAREISARRRSDEETVERQTVGRLLLAGAIVVVVVLGAGAMFAQSSPTTAEASTGCNGSIELCDRRVDEVVFAGSHNAMSSIDLGWDLAPQRGDMVAQLDHGVRALLIDTHYWDGTGEVEGAGSAEARLAIERALSDDEPRPGAWLCHGYCALGATRLDHGLASIKVWLDSNPNDVVLMIVQDEITTADTLDAFEASGLVDLVHDHRPGTPWPTLGELIERDERLLVWAENAGTSDSWYQNAYDSTFQETGYAFTSVADFDCAPNRGADDHPLFLVNHWISTGIPTIEAASLVNSRDVLLDRIRACADARGLAPTIVATDFVEVGDLVDVVADLNAGVVTLDVD